ncbi:MAG: Fic family protein [Candidatus Omnitrophica bacterium]|nr:Fic family protein [Candidatus Omnitrophota bacterium]
MKYVWQYSNWPNLTWQSEKLLVLLGQSRYCQGRLLAKVRKLGVSFSRHAQAEIMIEEAIKTSEIEGQKLLRDSVRSSVARHLGLPAAGLPSSNRHIDGLIDVLLDATANYNKPLSPKRLKSWHAALFPTGFSGLHNIRAGKWRGPHPMQVVSGPVGREKVHFQAPPMDRIDKEMNHFFSWWEKSLRDIEGLLRAGIAHFRFVTIHPFEDGNGRLARALTDMALAQDEKLPVRFYSLSSRIMEERKDYYIVLEHCQKGSGDITEWLLWFLGCFVRAVENSEKLISKVLAKAGFWERHAQTIVNERQRKVVNRLLDAGQGEFKGGLTTRKYVSMAKVSKATAYREISDLTNKKILEKTRGKGRNISYELVWHRQ